MKKIVLLLSFTLVFASFTFGQITKTASKTIMPQTFTPQTIVISDDAVQTTKVEEPTNVESKEFKSQEAIVPFYQEPREPRKESNAKIGFIGPVLSPAEMEILRKKKQLKKVQ